MSKKSDFLMRLLGVLTAIVTAAGLALLLPVVFALRSHKPPSPLGSEPSAALALGLMAGLNVIFAFLLIVSAGLLWRRRRSGLSMLLYTLCAEALYFVALGAGLFRLSLSAAGAGGAARSGFVAALGAGNLVVGAQVATAYPVFAAVLIVLCRRQLRAPTQP